VNWLRRIRLAAVSFCALQFYSPHLFAQGCATCYTTAAAGGPQTAHALRSGILLLLFPPVLIFAALILTVRNWKNQASASSHFPDGHSGLPDGAPSVEATK